MIKGLKNKVEYYIPNEKFSREFVKLFNKELIHMLSRGFDSFIVNLPEYVMKEEEILIADKIVNSLVSYYQLNHKITTRENSLGWRSGYTFYNPAVSL